MIAGEVIFTCLPFMPGMHGPHMWSALDRSKAVTSIFCICIPGISLDGMYPNRTWSCRAISARRIADLGYISALWRTVPGMLLAVDLYV